MLYVYAIMATGVAPAGEVDAARGFGNNPVRFHTLGQIHAAVSDFADTAPTPTVENVLTHERVLESLLRHSTLLPTRFGTLFPNPDALHAVLARNEDRLVAGLRKVRGCVEVGVRATWLTPHVETVPAGQRTPQPVSGRAYMVARLEEDRQRRGLHARATGIAEELHSRWMAHAVDGTRQVLPAPGVPVRGAYLVLRENVDAFRLAVRASDVTSHDLRLTCTGPWPPYHFVPDLNLAGSPM